MALRLEDRDLVIAYQAGDDEAFAELVREYRPGLLNHARRRLSCNESAEDAVQETLVRALRAMPRFNGNYLVEPWLHRILTNVCIDEGNRRRREGEKTERAAVNDSSLQPTPSVETELGLDLDLSDVVDAVEGLSEPYREALQLRFVDELSYDEVAKAAGVSEDNARARVSRARTALRAALRVAAFLPVALIGLLRRGERAASAVTGHASGASHSSIQTAMPLLAEAAPVAPRAVAAVANTAVVGVPVLAKAAMGLGLATAVIAPTVDSTVHRAAERVLPPGVIEAITPFAVESIEIDAPVVVPEIVAAPVVVATATETPAVIETTEAVEEPAQAAAAPVAAAAVAQTAAIEEIDSSVADAPEAAVDTHTSSVLSNPTDTGTSSESLAPDVTSSESLVSEGASAQTEQTGSSTTDEQSGTTAEETAAEVAEPTVTTITTSMVDGAALSFTSAGADRYDVTGTLSVTVTSTATTTNADGEETVETMTVNDSVAVVAPSTASLSPAGSDSSDRRFSALLVFAPGSDGASAEMRLAARGTPAGDTSLTMSGFFTATPTASLPLDDRGTLSGTLTLDADGMPASLTVTLTQ